MSANNILFSEKEVQEAVRLYTEERQSLTQTARQLGRSRTSVRKYLDLHGVLDTSRRDQYFADEEQEREIVRLYTEEGFTAQKIVLTLGRSLSTVRGILVRADVYKPFKNAEDKAGPDWDDLALWNRVREAYAEHKSIHKAAALTGVGRHSVRIMVADLVPKIKATCNTK